MSFFRPTFQNFKKQKSLISISSLSSLTLLLLISGCANLNTPSDGKKNRYDALKGQFGGVVSRECGTENQGFRKTMSSREQCSDSVWHFYKYCVTQELDELIPERIDIEGSEASRMSALVEECVIAEQSGPPQSNQYHEKVRQMKADLKK